jgi:chemotaxis protein MotB
MTSRDPSAPEIVIVRRRVADDMAAGKGGAWKIAYADFVTAMMAFFLVMWLINASNEETRAQVASYFNPIKLTDSRTGPRSLRDAEGEVRSNGLVKEQNVDGEPPPAKDVRAEAAFLADPQKSLDRVAAKAKELEEARAPLKPVKASGSQTPLTPNPGVGDPFDPRSWKATTSPVEQNSPLATEEAPSPAPVADPKKVAVSENHHPDDERSSVEAPRTTSTPELGQDKAGTSSVPDKAKESGAKTDEQSDLKKLFQDIATELGATPDELGQWLAIRQSPDGLLISLTESANFEMFKTGSAEPEPEMLRLVTAVAKAIMSRPESILIRGHTDSRPFRNKYFDNWQLSTSRAHVARYMLLRAGVDEKRIGRIEGVADREPLIPSDPLAPENRRIELLLSQSSP